jgi:hypothetical protein
MASKGVDTVLSAKEMWQLGVSSTIVSFRKYAQADPQLPVAPSTPSSSVNALAAIYCDPPSLDLSATIFISHPMSYHVYTAGRDGRSPMVGKQQIHNLMLLLREQYLRSKDPSAPVATSPPPVLAADDPRHDAAYPTMGSSNPRGAAGVVNAAAAVAASYSSVTLIVRSAPVAAVATLSRRPDIVSNVRAPIRTCVSGLLGLLHKCGTQQRRVWICRLPLCSPSSLCCTGALEQSGHSPEQHLEWSGAGSHGADQESDFRAVRGSGRGTWFEHPTCWLGAQVKHCCTLCLCTVALAGGIKTACQG